MSYQRECVIFIVSMAIGLVFGIAVSPKPTGFPIDNFKNKINGIYVSEDGKQKVKHGYADFTQNVGQCVLFEDKKLIGVEYVINEYQYEKLTKVDKEGWERNDPSCSWTDGNVSIAKTYSKIYILRNGHIPDKESNVYTLIDGKKADLFLLKEVFPMTSYKKK